MASTAVPEIGRATFGVERPDHPLDRVTTARRVFTVIPAAILLATVSGGGVSAGGDGGLWLAFGGPGLLFLPPLLMLVLREKYPRWWFEFNRELLRFSARVGVYAALLTDVRVVAYAFALVTDDYPPFRLAA